MDDFTKRDDVVKYVAIVVKTSNAETKQALFIIGKQCQKQEHENTLGIVVFGMPLGIVLVALWRNLRSHMRRFVTSWALLNVRTKKHVIAS